MTFFTEFLRSIDANNFLIQHRFIKLNSTPMYKSQSMWLFTNFEGKNSFFHIQSRAVDDKEDCSYFVHELCQRWNSNEKRSGT
jgi:hypothetical protein